MPLDLRIAETDEEKERVFKFRYQIYVEEMGRPCHHADHGKKTLTDQMDQTGTIMYATDSEEIVGTIRTNLRKHGPIEFEDEYGIREMDEFKLHYPQGISTTTKLMVAKPYRGKLTPDLIRFLHQFGLENEIVYDFINVNPPLDRWYERMGYRRYKEPFQHPEFGEVIPMVLLLKDLKI